MSDHLPECPVPHMDGVWGLPLHPEDAEANCICPQLRACEQRVKEESARGFAPFLVTSPLNHDILCRMSYNAALDAAREAVAGVKKFVEFPGQPVNYIHPDFFLAAIDALKKKP